MTTTTGVAPARSVRCSTPRRALHLDTCRVLYFYFWGTGHACTFPSRKPSVPQAVIGLLLRYLEAVEFLVLNQGLATGANRRFVTVTSSERPIKNSTER